MNAKSFLLEQLKATYNEKGWLVSFRESVQDLTAENAVLKNSSGTHNIWGIVDHLIFWNGRWLARLKGEAPAEMKIDNAETFASPPPDEKSWDEEVKKLESILSDIISIVESSDDSFLGSEAFPGYGASWYEMFAQFNLHNAYHIGQIVLLRKEQGTWNPDLGVSA